MNSAPTLYEMIGPDGQVGMKLLVATLRVTKTELAHASGISWDSLSKASRLNSRATQAKLRDFVEIIYRVLPWTGSLPQAFAWYRAQAIPSFGDRTAEDLVKAGHAKEVMAYLSRLAVGGYA
jgi:hypothetical protein